MSSPRFACLSSSGKYFMCLGRLWGHCCSAPSAGAAHSKRRADGSERSVEICILERAARCVLVATGKCRARNAECCCTRDSRIHYTSVRWLVEPRRANHSNREAGMTMRWRLTAAMVSCFIFKATNQRLLYACCYGSASSSPISHVLFDVRSRKRCDVISTVVEQPRFGLKLTLSTTLESMHPLRPSHE
jgi:hypothetical protein